MDYCLEALESDLQPYEFKMVLLKAGVHDTNEIMWIYRKLYDDKSKEIKNETISIAEEEQAENDK